MFPYLDLAGFKRRTSMPSGEVDYVEADSPGYTASRIAVRSSYINGRLRKRYGNGGNTHNPVNSLPLGQTPPLLEAVIGPAATLTGRPVLGSLQVLIRINAGGVLGVATFDWSIDGGASFVATGVVTGASVPLTGTGMSVSFPSGTFTAGDIQTASTPVPEIVLGWLATMVTYDVLRKRGVNPQDPIIEMLREDLAQVFLDLKEAADSKDGLFDLPASEDLDSAVSTGGPLGHSDGSPYGWQEKQAIRGSRQDGQQLEGIVGPLDPWWFQ